MTVVYAMSVSSCNVNKIDAPKGCKQLTRSVVVAYALGTIGHLSISLIPVNIRLRVACDFGNFFVLFQTYLTEASIHVESKKSLFPAHVLPLLTVAECACRPLCLYDRLFHGIDDLSNVTFECLARSSTCTNAEHPCFDAWP